MRVSLDFLGWLFCTAFLMAAFFASLNVWITAELPLLGIAVYCSPFIAIIYGFPLMKAEEHRYHRIDEESCLYWMTHQPYTKHSEYLQAITNRSRMRRWRRANARMLTEVAGAMADKNQQRVSKN